MEYLFETNINKMSETETDFEKVASIIAIIIASIVTIYVTYYFFSMCKKNRIYVITHNTNRTNNRSGTLINVVTLQSYL